MNRLSQTIFPLALGLGLAMGLESSAIASPRYSHQQHNRSGVVIISPSRHGNNHYDDYEVDYRHGRNIDYGRRDRYRDRYDNDDYYERDYRRRSRRYNSYDCDRRNYRVNRRRRNYSGNRNYRRNGSYIKIIRY